MPFGEYADFAACLKANQDKKSPEGYCSSIHKKITGEWPGVKKMDTLTKAKESITRVDEDGSVHVTGITPRVIRSPESLKPGTIKKAMDFVMKAVSIDTSSYEGSHGRHPRIGPYVGARMHQTSKSPWMVEIGGKQHEFRGTYKDAMTQAKTKAREMGSGSVKVLP